MNIISDIKIHIILIIGNIIFAYMANIIIFPFYCTYFISKNNINDKEINEFPNRLGKFYDIGIINVRVKFLRAVRKKGINYIRNHLLLRALFPTLIIMGGIRVFIRGVLWSEPNNVIAGFFVVSIQLVGLYLVYTIPRKFLRIDS